MIYLVGSYPPPYGGISTHIERLHDHLRKAGLASSVYTLRREATATYGVCVVRNRLILYGKLIAKILTDREAVVHLHTLPVADKLFLGFLGAVGAKTILTIHGDSLWDQLVENRIYQLGRLKKIILLSGLNRIDHFIAVNSRIHDFLLSIGISEQHIDTLPAFLPPVAAQEVDLPMDVVAFLKSGRKIISMNAYGLVFYKNQDLYGIDMAITLCRRLKDAGMRVGLLCLIGQVGEQQSYFVQLKDRIVAEGLEQDMLLFSRTLPFVPLLRRSDLFLRPTNTDGDAVSIREALHLGIPVVASDVVERPSGSVVFKNRDDDDLLRAVTEVLMNIDRHRARIAALPNDDNAAKIIRIYRRCAGNLEERDALVD